MNIYAPTGSKVKYVHPFNGYHYDYLYTAQHLTLGEIYTVSYTEVGGVSTRVHFQETGDLAFNSVMFEDVEE